MSVKFKEGLENYGLCLIAKDAGSKWSKPGKVIRTLEDISEAITLMDAKEQGINVFTGLQRGAVNKAVKDASDSKKDTKHKYTAEQTRIYKLEQDNKAMNNKLDQIIDKLG